MPDAKAMENPAAIATQLTPLAASPCANAGTPNESTESAINNLLNLLIVFLLMKYRQWVVDAIPCRRPHAERLVLSSRFSVKRLAELESRQLNTCLVLIRDRALQINRGQQDEDV